MKRPSFQFYSYDWSSNANLKRCSHAEKGIWIDVLCLMHDSEEYGIVRWPLAEIAQSIGTSTAKLRRLVDKSVLKGSDEELRAPVVYVPRSGRRDGAPVVLIPAQPGPIWYSSRMVRDEYVRSIAGASTRFGADRRGAEDTTPSPRRSPSQRHGEDQGERQGAGNDAPRRTPSQGQGDGSSSSSSSSIHSSSGGSNPDGDARGEGAPPPPPEFEPVDSDPQSEPAWLRSDDGKPPRAGFGTGDGIDVDLPPPEDRTAVQQALIDRCLVITKLLRDRGAGVNASNPHVVGWASSGVTDAQVLQALEIAESRRQREANAQPINAGYLNSILRDLGRETRGDALRMPVAPGRRSTRDRSFEEDLHDTSWADA